MPRRTLRAPLPGHKDARLPTILERLEQGGSLSELDLRGLRVEEGDLGQGRAIDFTRSDLRGASFDGLDLSGSRFCEADLSGVSFRNVTLSRADLSGSAARGAVFTDVNLVSSSFAGADLRGAILFNANLADVSFKGASLEGAEVDAIRLSLNGSTHVLGLKEALRALADETSYPYVMGVSGDAFWLAYFLKTHELSWGGFAKDALRRGLESFGFPCELRDEVDEDDAWDALREALGRGSTVITPLHVTAGTTLGSGLGGSEWVFVTGIDRGDVLVNCLLGDGLRFSPERFRAGWCVHHPLEPGGGDLPIIYAMCEVGARERIPERGETTRVGLRSAVEILELDSTEKVAFGFDAYSAMVQDLQEYRDPGELAPDELRRFLPWLGLGMLHHHGSRWAIRDFLEEVLQRNELDGAERDAIVEASALYDEVCADLKRFLEVLPWSFDTDDPLDRQEALARYRQHREEAADLLSGAAARERDALERFRAVVAD